MKLNKRNSRVDSKSRKKDLTKVHMHNKSYVHKESKFYIAGRNSVIEAVRTNNVKKVFIKRSGDARLLAIVEEIKKRSVSIIETEEEFLNTLVSDVKHQGIVAVLKPFKYAELNVIIENCFNDSPLLLLLDGIEDVRNLGAIVRTAECAGIQAVLLPANKGTEVTASAMKTAAGAFSTMPVCKIGNVRQTLESLKKKGFWIVGADMAGSDLYYDANLKGPLVIVMGAEGKGLSRLTKETCDFLVRIPMKGKISSLNVSVAAGLLLYEAIRQRS